MCDIWYSIHAGEESCNAPAGYVPMTGSSQVKDPGRSPFFPAPAKAPATSLPFAQQGEQTRVLSEHSDVQRNPRVAQGF